MASYENEDKEYDKRLKRYVAVKRKIRENSKKEVKEMEGVKEILPEKPKENEKSVEEMIKENKKPAVNHNFIILGVVVVLIIIFTSMLFLIPPTQKAKFKPIDMTISKTSGLNMHVNFNSQPLFSLSGWESMLNYNNQTQRLAGTESYKKIISDENGAAYTYIVLDDKIQVEPLKGDSKQITKNGWFTNPNQISINEKIGDKKEVDIQLTSTDSIKNSFLNITLFKNQPFFNIQFDSKPSFKSNLGNFGYGFSLKDFDVYLENGTILKNDNKITTLNKTISLILNDDGNITNVTSDKIKEEISNSTDLSKEAITRSGSTYKVNNSDYELFYNNNTGKGIIVYAPQKVYFENLFTWNVFRVYVPYKNNAYSPVYFIVLEDAKLSYTNNDWDIQSKDFKGSVRSIIQEVLAK